MREFSRGALPCSPSPSRSAAPVDARTRRAAPRHRDARRAGAARGLQPFRYANPAAPKGGRLVQGVVGSFDNLNPFIVRGLPPQGLRAPLVSGANIISGYVVESLMVRGYDEPFTLYGLLAQSVETDAARTYVTFALDPAARFSDGKPVTAQDVVFSWELLRDHGRPNHRIYYSKVAKADVLDERTVRFDLTGANDRELPLILGLMPVLAKHAVNAGTFEEPSMTPLVGSGPYCVGRVDPGKSITLDAQSRTIGGAISPSIAASGISTRSASTITATPAPIHEAFKAGLFDVRKEDDPGPLADRLRFPGAARQARRSRRRSPPACRSRASTSSSTRGARCSPTSACARRSRCCSISSGSTARSSSISTAAARASSRAPSSPRAAARPTSASARCSRLSGRGPPRHARRHLAAAGDRRLGPRPRAAAPRARPARRCRLRAARHRAGREGRRQALRLRDPRPEPRRGAPRPPVRRASSSAPGSPRRCGLWMRYNTRRGESPSIST